MTEDELNQLAAYLRVRGDVAVALLEDTHKRLSAIQAGLIKTLDSMKDIDKALELKGAPRSNLASLLRDFFGEQTQGMSDEEVIAFVAKTNK